MLVRAGSALAVRVEARWVEAPDLAVLVEDRQEEKEHREFEQAWTRVSSRLSLVLDVWATLSCQKPTPP